MNSLPNILLSIVIPSIPSRFDRSILLYQKINRQIESLENPSQVEVLMVTDNKRRSIGKKREACVAIACGLYTAILDDDDDVSDDYILQLITAIINQPPLLADVICFITQVNNEEGSYLVDMDMNHTENEQPHTDENGVQVNLKRPPWHVCAWLSSISKSVPFADVGYGEDWHWVQQLIEKSQMRNGPHIKINQVLHYYNENPETSEAPLHNNDIWINPNT